MRRSPIVERAAAQALDETALISAEPVTVVLSEKGWARAAKGHDVDPGALNYKSGDSYLHHVPARSNQPAMFIDSTGRVYSIPAHTLPSARGQGEPLTGRLNPPAGATFRGVMAGEGKQRYLLASDAGYGFVAPLEELFTKNKTGKAALKVARGAQVLPPAAVGDPAQDLVAAVTSEGNLLLHPVAELPEMGKGKGNKIIAIPAARAASREEVVTALAVVAHGQPLTLYSGKRHLTLKPADLAHYLSERGKRGSKLPRGFRSVQRIEAGERA